jgi:hypothetical protein
VTIYVDYARPALPSLAQRKLEKGFCCDSVPFRREQKINGLPAESMALYKYVQCPETRMYVSSTRHDRLG